MLHDFDADIIDHGAGFIIERGIGAIGRQAIGWYIKFLHKVAKVQRCAKT